MYVCISFVALTSYSLFENIVLIPLQTYIMCTILYVCCLYVHWSVFIYITKKVNGKSSMYLPKNTTTRLFYVLPFTTFGKDEGYIDMFESVDTTCIYPCIFSFDLWLNSFKWCYFVIYTTVLLSKLFLLPSPRPLFGAAMRPSCIERVFFPKIWHTNVFRDNDNTNIISSSIQQDTMYLKL